MKNENMIRDHGKKRLYFTDVETCARFVNLYKHLFIGDWFKTNELVTTRGKIYELVFMMAHEDMYNIRKSLGGMMKKKSFAVKGYYGDPYRRTREFVEA